MSRKLLTSILKIEKKVRVAVGNNSNARSIIWNPGLGRINVIARDPFDSDILYVGTGDKDANDTYNIGVLKSMVTNMPEE